MKKTALEIAVAALERIGQSDRHRTSHACDQCDTLIDTCDEEHARRLSDRHPCAGAQAREALAAIRSAPVDALADDAVFCSVVGEAIFKWLPAHGVAEYQSRSMGHVGLAALDAYRRGRAR